jgi:RNA polymerase sigma-70 factor (ECF subfamily)
MGAESKEFERIFVEHAGFVWRVLARCGVPDRDLEDVSQEVFVVVLKALPEFERRSSLQTWIYGICRRVAANHRDRSWQRRERPHPDPVLPVRELLTEDTAFEALATKQSLALLDDLLANLPAAQREVFVLYEIEEFSMREVAQALDCRLTTAFARLYSARREIAAALKRLRAKRRVA